MKYIYYYIWLGLAMTHPWFAKVLIPLNLLIMKVLGKTEKDYQEWKKNYSKALLEFPGGINDWFAFAFLLAVIYGIMFFLLFYFDEYTMSFLKSDVLFSGLLIGIIVFCYYWIYFRKIDWLKERINKVSKKYYIKPRMVIRKSIRYKRPREILSIFPNSFDPLSSFHG